MVVIKGVLPYSPCPTQVLAFCPAMKCYVSVCKGRGMNVCLAIPIRNLGAADPTLQDMDIDEDLQQAMALSMQVSFNALINSFTA